VVGDVMLDANRRLAPLARERSRALEQVLVEPGRYLLLTLHRPANTEPQSLSRIVAAVEGLGEPVVFPAHPRTAAAIATHAITVHPNVRLLPPAGYLDFAALASQARVVLTDSGGVQKEAYWYGVPCVTLRTTTEWPETIEAGWNRLAGSDPERIAAAVAAARPQPTRPQLYGDGNAAERIAETLVYTMTG
jgi:UDP-GlcNAc3NAcA epimerase